MTRLAIALTALAVSLVAASTAGAAVRTEFFGIAQGMSRLDNQDLQGMQNARVQTERFLLRWADVQPNETTTDWTEIDQFVGNLASHGIRPVPFVWGTPRWVAGKFGRPPLDTAADEQAWTNFLQLAVARYGRGGTFWAPGGVYDQQHPGATDYPIQAWQVWNEPNLPKYFAPSPSAVKYARLLEISHDTIKAQDPQALIVLAGMVGYAELKAWTFLDNLYQVAGVKGDFDAAALHPYAPDENKFINAVNQFRSVMTQNSDGATPVWFTEIGWGSNPPDSFGINKGIEGQERLLRRSFNDIVDRRASWNVRRVFWFYWRDPSTHPPGTCSFCSSAGLLRFNRTAKPAYNSFLRHTKTAPQVTIGSGPTGATNDPTPTFSFTATKPPQPPSPTNPLIEAGATFKCRFDAQAFSACSSPFTRASPLSDGAHTFQVKGTDANGNESAVKSRSFTVDTVAPATPQITATVPASPANNNSPKLKGSAASGSTVRLYKTTGCTGSAAAAGSAAQFASPGLGASVADNTTTPFRATATDAAGNTSGCSSLRNYVEDSTPPQTTITGGPTGATADSTPTFTFSSNQAGSTFKCRFDAQVFAACSGPGASHTPSTPLTLGTHTFRVRATDRAGNTDQTPAERTFTVTP